MEDKTLNPAEFPEDMPALNPDSPEDASMTSPAEPMEPLFENTAPEEEPEEVVVLDAAPLEPENTPEELLEILPVQDPPEQSETSMEESLPPVDFSQFDVPVDDPVSDPEEAASAAAPPAADTAAGDTMIFTSAYLGDSAMDDSTDPPQAASPMQDDPADPDFPAGETIPQAPILQPSQESQSVRKSRPRRKKGDGLFGIPHLLATFIWLAIILVIGVSLGRMLWLCAADVLAFGRESKEVVITISTHDTIDDIAEKLHEKGLIQYPGLFKLYADIAVDEGEIAPGTYTLDTILDYHALVGSMSSSSSNRAVVEDVLIPEGYNCRQIFELLEQNGICTVAELEEYAANGEFQEFWFLEGVERGDKYCLEGFLFPDTYDFYAGSTPREALGKMLLGFNSRIDQEELAPKLAALNERISAMMKSNGCSEEFIAENQMGLYELLTVASLIEEETAGASESPDIASVIFNRLTQNEVFERYLGIDAAIIYATGDAENIDTGIDSPYNTYTNAGLTPTPISNPGLSSINAALEFSDTDYYYYVLNPETQLHQFSKTYEEHQEWIEKFRGGDE